jgi:DAPG hydrolase PhiG domain
MESGDKMNPIESHMGRRQFLIGASVTPASFFAFSKIAELLGPEFPTGTVMAAEKVNNEDLREMNVSEKFKMPKWVIDEVLSPGYGPKEVGYQQLENGDALVCTRARFDNCNTKIVDWWITDYLKGTKEYQFWHQDHTSLEWDASKKPGTIINATHISGEYWGDKFIPMWISFYDPAEILGIKEYPDKAISSVTCASIWVEGKEKKLLTSLLQVGRNTYYGCEMRLRFNVIGTKAESCAGLMQHSLDEMANLAGFLPGLYAREQVRTANNPRA